MTSSQGTMIPSRGIVNYTGSERDFFSTPDEKAATSAGWAMQSGYWSASPLHLKKRLDQKKVWLSGETLTEEPATGDVKESYTEPWSLLSRDWVLPEKIAKPLSLTSTAVLRQSSGRSETGSPQPTKFTKAIRKDSLDTKQDNASTISLQHWECVITEVLDDVVCCEMHDLSDESNPREYAEVYIAEFSEFDRPLLSEGTVFYWSIGHSRKRSGQITRSSELRVRRMPKLTKNQSAQISRKVQKLNEIFGK